MARNPLIFIVLLAVISCTFLSCCRGFIVTVEGKYGDAVYFRFHDPVDGKITKYNVIELIIQEKKEGNQWDVIWALSGEQSIDEVQYGKKYEGFNEITQPRVLSLKGEYRVHVKDMPRFEPPGYGYARFTFNESGEIVMLR